MTTEINNTVKEDTEKFPEVPETLEDKSLPVEIDTLSLDRETADIANNIIKAKTSEELKDFTDLFSLNQIKKNAIRIMKLNNLLDKVNDKAIEHFEKRPDEVSDDTIIKYMREVQNQIVQSTQTITKINDTPITSVSNTTNEVTININDSDESNDRIINAVKQLLRQINTQDVIDVDVVENENPTNIENDNV